MKHESILCVWLLVVVCVAEQLSLQAVKIASLNVNVNGRFLPLILYEGQSITGAASGFCDSTAVGLPLVEKPQQRDKCVVDTVSILANELGMVQTISQASIGPILVNTSGRGSVGFFDPKDTGGSSKLHIEIQMPLQVENGASNSSKAEYVLRVPPWTSAEVSAEKAVKTIGLWKAEDYVLIRNKIRLEKTRKSTPVESVLRAINDEWKVPAVSFDEFFPSYFILHWPVIFLDWNRIKVAGPFFPPADGSVCVQFDIFSKSHETRQPKREAGGNSVLSLTSEAEYKEAEHITSCFTETETFRFDFSKISTTSRHRMLV